MHIYSRNDLPLSLNGASSGSPNPHLLQLRQISGRK